MPISAGRTAALLLFSLLMTLAAAPAFAEPITLKHSGGNLEMRGELISFDGKNYVIEVDVLGRVTLGADKFRCEGQACPRAAKADSKPASANTKTVNITGSATIGSRLMPALIHRYAGNLKRQVKQTGEDGEDLTIEMQGASEDAITVDLRRRGSDTAFPALASREAQIGMADRPITDQEIGMLAKAGFKNMNRPKHEHVIGLDGIIIITSLRNFVAALSIEDLSKIFSGDVQDWSEFGLPPGKINVYAPNEASGTLRTFSSLVLKPYKRTLTADAKRFETDSDLAKQVAEDRNGIGIASFAELTMAKAVAIKDSCGLIHPPSAFTVKTGEYPLSRKLFLYTTELNQPLVAELVRFASSEQAYPALNEIGFIDQSVVALPYDRQSDRIAGALNAAPEDFNMQLMRGLIDDLRGGERLSVTLRFEAGSAQLDSESVQNLLRLLHYLDSNNMTGEQILLAGFTDNSGAFDQNLALSVARANYVRDALLTASNGRLKAEQITVKAYSELVPVSCNDTAMGREHNRRVEVWIPRAQGPARAKLLIERL